VAKETHIGLDEVICHFSELEDPRSEINRKHPLPSVVVIALIAVLAGTSGPTGIAKWALLNKRLLNRLLPLPHGIPRKDVFRRVLATLKPDAFQACYRNWPESLREKAAAATEIDQPTLATDGKTSRRSHDQKKGLGALHSVSVWASEYGVSLGQVATEEKSNEITAIPVLLKLVDIRGAIITIDAMGTQAAIAEQIVDGQADYVLALKGTPKTKMTPDATVREHSTTGRGELYSAWMPMTVNRFPVRRYSTPPNTPARVSITATAAITWGGRCWIRKTGRCVSAKHTPPTTNVTTNRHRSIGRSGRRSL
jgi:hypothetical protein